MIEGVFPIPVGRYNIERPFVDVELNAIDSQDKISNFGNSISSNKAVLDLPELKQLKELLETYLNDFFKSVHSPKNDIKIYITQSWLNWTIPGQFHHKHAHPNSFISGVLYIHAEKETDKIMFHKDAYQQFEIKANDHHILNSNSWWFPVGTGDLLLFSSSLIHSVPELNEKHVRVSLSFNTFIEGELGIIDGPTLLTLKK